MKKLNAIVMVLFAAILILLPSGCATTQTKPSCAPDDQACLDAQRQATLEKWAARLKALATDGIPLAYQALPPDKQDNFLDALKKAQAGLATLAGPDLSLDQIVKIMSDSGVKQLADKDAQMAIAGGKLILSFVGIELSVTKPADVELFRVALYDGITAGITSIQQ